jgi:hypothetical protein
MADIVHGNLTVILSMEVIEVVTRITPRLAPPGEQTAIRDRILKLRKTG